MKQKRNKNDHYAFKKVHSFLFIDQELLVKTEMRHLIQASMVVIYK